MPRGAAEAPNTLETLLTIGTSGSWNRHHVQRDGGEASVVTARGCPDDTLFSLLPVIRISEGIIQDFHSGISALAVCCKFSRGCWLKASLKEMREGLYVRPLQ